MSGVRRGPRSTAAGQQGMPGDWADEAACKGKTAVFFPTGADEALAEAAKAICDTCPVSDPCLDFALATGQGDGIWAGTTPDERRRLRRYRRKVAS